MSENVLVTFNVVDRVSWPIRVAEVKARMAERLARERKWVFGIDAAGEAYDILKRTPPHNEEATMPPDRTPNPYDRRSAGPRSVGGRGETLTTDASTRRPGLDQDHERLTLEDLDNLVESKVGRARADARQTEAEAAAERTVHAQRDAWDHGHKMGEIDGVMAYWQAVEPAVINRVQVIAGEANRLAAILDSEPRKVTKGDLREFLGRLADECESLGGLFDETLRPDRFHAARDAGL